jgi:hypothetical protein
MSTIPFPPLPTDTARAAESVFGREHPYLKLGDTLVDVWTRLKLSKLGSTDNFLSKSFYPYSLVTILQYWESLTDRQMSQATRTRLDMKYALHLPLNYPGIDPEALCEFRQHVLASPAAIDLLEEMVRSMSSYRKQRADELNAEDIVASICLPSRAENILECMDIAIEAVAALDPDWLKTHTLPHWYRRYHLKLGYRKLPFDPTDMESLIESVGHDGWHLLRAIGSSNASRLAQLPEIGKLQREWQRQFSIQGDSIKFREAHCLICSNELQAIRNTLKRKETGKLSNAQKESPPGTKNQEPGK